MAAALPAPRRSTTRRGLTGSITTGDRHAIANALAQEAIPVGNSGRLLWLSTSAAPAPHIHSDFHFFSVDSALVYEPFFADFGPYNLGHVYRYCQLLDAKFSDPALANKKIVHYCSTDARIRPNSAFLICAYQVVRCGISATEAYEPFQHLFPPFTPYRDATYGLCTYHLTVLDCVKALEFGIKLGWFDYKTFDIKEYEQYERVENGDLNWIIPGKFVAFSGPVASSEKQLYVVFAPEDYVSLFKRMGVRLVIRLNKKQYERRRFVEHGIQHADLYFVDGSCPSIEIIQKFLDICENEPGAIAVHCKAGLGRTGTLIGCYAMKNYKFPAHLWIGWNRICRPGSVLGPQQYFMRDMEAELMAMPSIFKPPPLSLLGHQRVEPCSASAEVLNSKAIDSAAAVAETSTAEYSDAAMSPEMRHVAEHGDLGQGERLMLARQKLSAIKFVEDQSDTPLSCVSTAPPTSPAGSLTPESPASALSATYGGMASKAQDLSGVPPLATSLTTTGAVQVPPSSRPRLFPNSNDSKAVAATSSPKSSSSAATSLQGSEPEGRESAFRTSATVDDPFNLRRALGGMIASKKLISDSAVSSDDKTMLRTSSAANTSLSQDTHFRSKTRAESTGPTVSGLSDCSVENIGETILEVSAEGLQSARPSSGKPGLTAATTAAKVAAARTSPRHSASPIQTVTSRARTGPHPALSFQTSKTHQPRLSSRPHAATATSSIEQILTPTRTPPSTVHRLRRTASSQLKDPVCSATSVTRISSSSLQSTRGGTSGGQRTEPASGSSSPKSDSATAARSSVKLSPLMENNNQIAQPPQHHKSEGNLRRPSDDDSATLSTMPSSPTAAPASPISVSSRPKSSSFSFHLRSSSTSHIVPQRTVHHHHHHHHHKGTHDHHKDAKGVVECPTDAGAPSRPSQSEIRATAALTRANTTTTTHRHHHHKPPTQPAAGVRSGAAAMGPSSRSSTFTSIRAASKSEKRPESDPTAPTVIAPPTTRTTTTTTTPKVKTGRRRFW